MSIIDAWRTAGIASIFGIVCLACPVADERGVDLKALKSIAIGEKPEPALEPLAQSLAKALRETYGLDLRVVKGLPPEREPAVILGRAAATASKMIAERDLEALQHDGYVLRGSDNRLAAAGRRMLGTRYAAYGLLDRLGVRFYPWHSGGPVRTFAPLKDARLAPFATSIRPFFEWRSLASHLDRDAIWGTTQDDTGDPRNAANPDILGAKRKPGYSKYPPKDLGEDWVDSQHTAGYLVPRDLYYETHPEYFAMRGGKRIAPGPYMRMPLCLTHRDVWKISTERALEWIGLQPDRRFFWIMDADAGGCTCPECVRTDWMPRHYSDRLLAWVNTVARAIKERYPEKIVLTAGYQESAWAPARVRPESNVRVLYCPWYWDARGAPGQSFAHPGNMTAMEQFLGWSMGCPEQTGLYFYPGELLWLRGLVDDVRTCAKNGARYVHFCGRSILFGELFQYVMARLIWDPYLDSEKLEEEFCRAFHGPAAGPILKYLALHHEAANRNARLFRDPEYSVKAPALLQQAEAAARVDEEVLMRTQDSILAWLDKYLPATCPRPGEPVSREKADAFRNELAWYERMNRAFRAGCEKRRLGWAARQREKAFLEVMAACGGKQAGPGPQAEDEDAMQRAFNYLDELAKKSPAQAGLAPEPKKSIELKFDTGEAVKGWDLDGTQAELLSPPVFAAVRCPDGEELRGGKVTVPLSRLPVLDLPHHAEGICRAHAGRFLMTVKLPAPLDATGCHFLEFRFHATRDVPITVYLDLGGVRGQHADFFLHAGEQIVRMDFRNLHRVDFDKWDRKIHGLKVDFWPQDNFHPFPPARDTEVTLAGVEARSYVPGPADLPHRGKAIWLVQHRANLQHNLIVDTKLLRRTKQGHPTNIDRSLYWEGEKFRSFTVPRALSPVFAILGGAGAGEATNAAQDYLGRMYGVTLPVDPQGLAAGPDTGNAIFVGRASGLASGRVTESELIRAGAEGFVLRAHQGRIVIAGGSGSGSACGVARYLEGHGVIFAVPGAREKLPDLKGSFLHELYLLDWPSFDKRPVPGGWRLRTQGNIRTWRTPGTPDDADTTAAERLAEAIKDCARDGKKAVPEESLQAANVSPLAAYVAAKLLWDPFADPSRLIREFQEGLGR